MATGAVAGYLRTLREGRRVSRAALAAQLGTSETTLWRIEQGVQQVSGELLMGLVAALDADLHDVSRLMLEREAIDLDGRRAAEALLQRSAAGGVSEALPEQDPHRLLLDELAEELRCRPNVAPLLQGVLQAWRMHIQD